MMKGFVCILLIFVVNICDTIENSHFGTFNDPSLSQFQPNGFHFPKIDSRNIFQSKASICPWQPIPVTIPLDPLPGPIAVAFQQVEQLFTDLMKNKSINPAATGMTASASYMGQSIWNFTFGGISNSSSSSPPDGDTIFRIGSVSKVFVAIMAYQLYESGYIRSLDDTISTYEPDFFINNPYPGSTGITFKQIASQLSGLPREAPCGPCNVTTETMLARIANLTLIEPPYNRPSYSNLGFALLGHVLEDIVEVNFQEYVQKNIIDLLQMKNTGFNITEAVISKMAVGYNGDGSVSPLVDIGWVAPAGQMYSTTNDMQKLVNWFMSSEGAAIQTSGLSANLIKEMMNPMYLQGDGSTMFATPFETYFLENYNVRTKGGNIYGYSALFSVIPELQLGMSVLWNTMLDEDVFGTAAYDILIPAFVETLIKIQPTPAQPLNQDIYTGTYIASGVAANVVVYQGLLLMVVSAPEDISFFLQYDTQTDFQIWFPQGIVSCSSLDLSALFGEFIVFQLDDNGAPVSFTVPGYLWGVTWVKQ